jgi:hypothetical protein
MNMLRVRWRMERLGRGSFREMLGGAAGRGVSFKPWGCKRVAVPYRTV